MTQSMKGGFLRDDTTGALVTAGEVDPGLNAVWRPAHNKLLAATTDPQLVSTQGAFPAANNSWAAKIAWPKTQSITNLHFMVQALATGASGCVAFVANTAGTRLGSVDCSTLLTAGSVSFDSDRVAVLTADSGGLTSVPGGPDVYLIAGIHFGTPGTSGNLRAVSSGAGSSINLAKTDVYRHFLKAFGGALPSSGISWTSDTGGAISETAAVWFGIS